LSAQPSATAAATSRIGDVFIGGVYFE